eukprot:3448764-Rhodomonas_salina.3
MSGSLGICCDHMVVHLLVLSANVGHSVVVNECGSLRRLLPRVPNFKFETGLDSDTNHMRFSYHDSSGQRLSIAVTRRGCIIMRMACQPAREYTEELVQEVHEMCAYVCETVCSLC